MSDDMTLPPGVNPLATTYSEQEPYTPPHVDQEQRDDAQREIAERANDLLVPVYPSGSNESRDRFLFNVPTDLRAQFDGICQDAAPDTSETFGMNDDDFEIFRHALMLVTHDVPAEHEAHHAPLIWAWVRVLCAGAGFKRHAEIAKELRVMFPLCPFDEAETHKAWMQELVDAHANCGWPVGLAWIDYSAVHSLYPDIQHEDIPEKWMRVLCTFHLVKHTRCSMYEGEGVIYQYRGVHALQTVKSRHECLGPTQRTQLVCALGGIKQTTKRKHVMSIALSNVITMIPPIKLIPVTQQRALDPHYLISPSACLAPWPENRKGFCRTGVGVDGVWYAQGGQVTQTRGKHKLSLSTYWGLPEAGAHSNAEFEDLIPKQYSTTQLPAAILRQTFPNMLSVGDDKVAYDCLLSAVILSGLMSEHLFRNERPVLMTVPWDTSDLDNTTNTGKTALAAAVARVFSLSLGEAQRIGSGAPAQRSALAVLRRHGTMALDEFDWSNDPSALFSEPNVLSMATGGAPNIGNVLSNDIVSASLSAPLCMSVKWPAGKLDLFTRTIPIILRQFTEQERADPIYNKITSGMWSIELRMTCLHLIDTFDLNGLIARSNPGGGSFRFNKLRALAAILYRASTKLDIADCFLAIDSCAEACVDKLEELSKMAVAGGVSAEAKSTGRAMFSIEAMVNDLNTVQFDDFALSVTEAVNARDIFHAYKDAKGMSKRPDQAAFEDLTGCEGVKGQRMTRAINKELESLVPNEGDKWQLNGAAGLINGWHLVRLKDRARYSWYTFEQIKQTTPTPSQTTPIVPPQGSAHEEYSLPPQQNPLHN